MSEYTQEEIAAMAGQKVDGGPLDWWHGYPPSGMGPLPVLGHPDCKWCYGTGARSYMPYRYCYCVGQGGNQGMQAAITPESKR